MVEVIQNEAKLDSLSRQKCKVIEEPFFKIGKM